MESRIPDAAPPAQRWSELFRAAAHDLSEPVRSVRGFAQLLQSRPEIQDNPELAEFVKFIQGGAERITAIVRGLEQYMRCAVADEKQAVTPAAELIAAALTQGGWPEDEAQIEWEAPGSVSISGTPARWVWLIRELVTNAVKFTRERPARIRIEAAAHQLRVIDHGIGIPAADGERVFEPFRRLHTRSEFPGNGLGLATCRQIVQTQGGSIHVEPTPGGGTTVAVRW